MKQQQPQLPPRKDMIDARDQLKAFLNTKGWMYLNNILQAQINGHAQQILGGVEAVDKDVHPMTYTLSTEYKKGVHQGLTIAMSLPKMLIEQLSADISKTEDEPEQLTLPGV